MLFLSFLLDEVPRTTDLDYWAIYYDLTVDPKCFDGICTRAGLLYRLSRLPEPLVSNCRLLEFFAIWKSFENHRRNFSKQRPSVLELLRINSEKVSPSARI